MRSSHPALYVLICQLTSLKLFRNVHGSEHDRMNELWVRWAKYLGAAAKIKRTGLELVGNC